MIPIQPLLPSLQKMAEFVKEATSKMQPLWNVYKTSIEHMRSLEAMTRNQKFDLTGLRHEVILSQPKYRYQTFPSPREIAQETAKEMLKILEQKKKSPSNQRITIHFSKDGDLYTNDKHYYSLQDYKVTRKLINVLGYEFTPTQKLALYVESKNTESLYKTVQAINRKTKFLLKIKANLIDGRRGSGYRINPKIHLIKEK